MSLDWMDSAACAQVGDPEIWYPKGRRGYNTDWTQPRKICIQCPVKDPCLFAALQEEATDQYSWGMRGAKDPKQRRAILEQVFGKGTTSWQTRGRNANMANLVEAARVLYADGDKRRAEAWSNIKQSRRQQSTKE